MKELDITKEDPCDGCIVLPMCKEVCILKNIHASYIHLIRSDDFIKVQFRRSTMPDYYFISVVLAGSTYSSIHSIPE